MSRLHPVSYGAGILLVPDWCNPVPEKRVVRPMPVKKEGRRARV